MADFYLRTGDVLPVLQATLQDANGNIIDLTTAVSVKFRMEQPGDGAAPVVNAAATVLVAQEGSVEYQWQPADTANAGDFDAFFQIFWPGSPNQAQTVPNMTPLKVRIAPL